jgi:hypothetical protein
MKNMDILDRKPGGPDNAGVTELRKKIVEHCKSFKTSWVNLGQALYPAWKDKLYYGWGFEKFEHYAREELGLKKETALKLLKVYFFTEQTEPSYLKEEFVQENEAAHVPGCDEINVLRLARSKKELTKDDYQQLKKAVFKDGKDASLLRKDLTALMRERKEVDPDEERQERNDAAIRKLASAIKIFSRDMETLKMAPADLLEEARKLLDRLEKEVE